MACSVSTLARSGVVSSLTVMRKSPFGVLSCVAIFLLLGLCSPAQSNTSSPKQTPPKQNSPQPNSPQPNSPKQTTPSPKGIHDVIATSFSAACNGDPDDSNNALAVSAVQPQLDLLAKEKDLDWSGTELFKIAKQVVPLSSEKVESDQAYIFHVDHWRSPYVLVSSDWFVYRGTKGGKLTSTGYTATGDQSLYGLKRALLVGIEIFDQGISGTLKFDYKLSVTQGSPENAQALGQLISALLGLASPASTQFQQGLGCSVLTGGVLQNGTKQLPFDLNVAESAYDPNKQKPDGTDTAKGSTTTASPGVADCSAIEKGTACTITRTFTSLDREWWDVGIGVTVPGVRETKYSIVNNALKRTATTHTDAYAMFDIYPFAALVTKDSGVPHFAVGLPLTSQTFYRPFFGISENLTGWNGFQRWSGVPTINFFAGVVYMKTSVVIGSPTTAAQLQAAERSTRVAKLLVGFEVPVKSLISKVGKSNTKNSNANAPKSSKSPGS